MGQENSILKKPDDDTSSKQKLDSEHNSGKLQNTQLSSNTDTNRAVQYIEFPFIKNDQTVSYISDSKVMFVMRGLPGSGKSELTRVLLDLYSSVVVCSADDYFLHEGRYEFNKDNISDAHEFCQGKAQRACEEDVNVIIIDNTNVRRWELEYYFDLADEYSYVVIVVEPQTPWKFNPDKLAKKNNHGAQRNFLNFKLQQWEIIIPLYFGWFLNESDSRMLYLVGQAHLEECFKISDFAEDFKNFSDTSQIADMLQYYAVPTSCPNGMLHCTSKFCLGGRVPDSAKYSTESAVIDACGCCYEICVVGFLITPRTFGARVKLNSDMLLLWGTEEKPLPKPESPLSEHFNPVRTVKHNQDFTIIHKDTKEHFAHCKASLICSTNVESPSFQPTSGLGSKAHITLGCASGVSAVTTGFDLVEIVNCESDPNISEKSKTYSLQHGWLRNYGKSRWMLYLQRHISAQSLFTGHYKLN